MISRNRSRGVGAGLAGLGVVAFVACGGTQNVASKYLKTASIGPAGGTLTVTSSDDPSLAGTSITIPPHALRSNVTISIGVSKVDVAHYGPSGATSAGPAVDFEPSGTTFALPVTMTLPVTLPAGASASDVSVEAVESDLSAKEIAAHVTGNLATLQVNGFTSFGVIVTGSSGDASVCATDADCPSGEVCVSGACVSTVLADGGPGPDASVEAGGGCTTSADCPLREECVAGSCVIPSSDAGTPEAGLLDGGSADATVVCTGSMTDCGGVCVDLATDSNNCGACRHVCASGQTCSASTCM